MTGVVDRQQVMEDKRKRQTNRTNIQSQGVDKKKTKIKKLWKCKQTDHWTEKEINMFLKWER